MIRAIALLVLAVVAPGAASANEPPSHVSSYELIWHVGNTEGLRFDLVKTQDSGKIVLASSGIGGVYFSLPLKDAPALAQALGRAEKVHSELKEGDTRKISVATHTVAFRSSAERGFSVVLGETSGYPFVSMNLQQALAVADWLNNAQTMMDTLNSSLRIP